MEYTKGEWKLHPKHAWVMDDNGSVIANCTGHKNPEANAYLITAAPNIYKALNDIIKAASFCHADAGLTIWINKAKEALAKAEGK